MIVAFTTVLSAACGGTRELPTIPPTVTPLPVTLPAPAATATPDPTRVSGTGTVQENSARSHVLTIRTSNSIWYVPWNAIVMLDGPRGTLMPADIPIDATITFAGIPDPLAKTPTLKEVTLHVQ